ncbi:MAG: putative molybdenum carrier protein, partial [Prosthecobacter sp.]|nr:putative molybdenum carrier protein [Prosthecobacter sp.]
HGRPLKLVDAAELPPEHAARAIGEFVSENALRSLNFAGPRASKWPDAADYARRAVTCLLRGQ